MTEPKDPLPSYVCAALKLQGYAFSDDRVAEITVQFERIAAIAQIILPSAAASGHAQDADAPDAHAGADAGTAPVFRP